MLSVRYNHRVHLFEIPSVAKFIALINARINTLARLQSNMTPDFTITAANEEWEGWEPLGFKSSLICMKDLL